MDAIIIDGKAYAGEINKETKNSAENFFNIYHRKPKLAVIIVGENEASKIYVRNKERACNASEIESLICHLPEDITQDEVEHIIAEYNQDLTIDGILVQLPLPGHLNEKSIMEGILPEKDVDGFHVQNLGALISGQEGFVPCTPKGIMRLIHSTGINLKGKHAVVIGRSVIVGKPISLLLLNEDCTVTICHSKTENLEEHVNKADILVVSVGVPELVKGGWIKKGAIVIDVGINRTEKGLIGDVEFEEAKKNAGFITPVPGGVGPMTIAMLLENTLQGAYKHEEKRYCK